MAFWFRCLPGVLLAIVGMVYLPGCEQAKEHPLPEPPGEKHSAAYFVEKADTAGLHYEWKAAAPRPLNILQTIGNGCAFLDYNRDGNLDILLVGPRLALYQGDGKGHFADVTHGTGLDKLSGHFLGCAVGDVDGDGYDDIYISGYRAGLLLHNEQGRSFRDISREAGIKPLPWGTSCAFIQTLPGTGRLDLYVGSYIVFGPHQIQYCKQRDLLTGCSPRFYTPLKGIFYRNDGTGHFKDSTLDCGAANVNGRGLGVVAADLDESGRPVISIANDELPGDLLHPSGAGLHYENTAQVSGTAYDREGNAHGGMGSDWGDYDNDGRFDLAVMTYQHEPKCLYHNDGKGIFTDAGIPAVVGSALASYVTFGCKFLDYDNDGWLDLAVTNGHVQDNIQQIDPTTTYRQPSFLFHNKGGSPVTFEDVSREAGPDFQRPLVGRGLAVGDYDNDGKLDLLLVDSEGKPLLLHNELSRAGHWLGVRLVGTRSNRDGYGAVLRAHVGEHTYLQQCQSDGSYLSASDSRVHFGLGAATKVDSVSVRWPSGKTQTYHHIPADHYITLREGEASVRP